MQRAWAPTGNGEGKGVGCPRRRGCRGPCGTGCGPKSAARGGPGRESTRPKCAQTMWHSRRSARPWPGTCDGPARASRPQGPSVPTAAPVATRPVCPRGPRRRAWCDAAKGGDRTGRRLRGACMPAGAVATGGAALGRTNRAGRTRGRRPGARACSAKRCGLRGPRTGSTVAVPRWAGGVGPVFAPCCGVVQRPVRRPAGAAGGAPAGLLCPQAVGRARRGGVGSLSTYS